MIWGEFEIQRNHHRGKKRKKSPVTKKRMSKLFSKLIKLTTHSRVLITPIFTVRFAVTFPRVENTTPVADTFEFQVRTGEITVFLVRAWELNK